MTDQKRQTTTVIALTAFAFAACFAWLGAVWAVTLIETRSRQAVASALTESGNTWASVAANGLQLRITGTAPSEAERFRALTTASALIDASRVIDAMDVTEALAIEPPRFSVELLRNGDGISLIGLIPASTDRAAIIATIHDLAAGAKVTDMLETADHPVPPGWDQAVGYGIDALKALPRSKISISAGAVAVTAISDSISDQQRLEADLARAVPGSLRVSLDISAPRPVITPFTTRFLIDAQGARFDACSVDTVETREIIIRAAAAAGLATKADCVIGLGVPSPDWAEAVATGIAGLAELGGGALTFSDADVSLVAGASVTQATFDRVVGDLEARLPDVFSLQAVMPDKTPAAAANDGPPEFTATLSESGQVQLRGRLPDELVRNAVDSYARSRFGSETVYTATRLDPNLPDGWPVRVLSALEALAELDHGDIKVQQSLLEVRGVTGNLGASANISRILSENLGTGQDFRIIVSYDKALDPDADLPTPRECIGSIDTLLTQKKITFSPGKAEIDPSAAPTLDGIARVMTRCGTIPIEIGGHTDAQGRDEMNLTLSQLRAEAVLEALRERKVLVAGFTAKGYGETVPIGDNKTFQGREANRRIEFKLLLSETEAARIAAETVAADAAILAATPAAGSGTPPTDAADPEAADLTPGPEVARPLARPGDGAVTGSPVVDAAIGSAAGAATPIPVPRSEAPTLREGRQSKALQSAAAKTELPVTETASGATAAPDAAGEIPDLVVVVQAPTQTQVRPRKRPEQN